MCMFALYRNINMPPLIAYEQYNGAGNFNNVNTEQ